MYQQQLNGRAIVKEAAVEEIQRKQREELEVVKMRARKKR